MAGSKAKVGIAGVHAVLDGALGAVAMVLTFCLVLSFAMFFAVASGLFLVAALFWRWAMILVRAA